MVREWALMGVMGRAGERREAGLTRRPSATPLRRRLTSCEQLRLLGDVSWTSVAQYVRLCDPLEGSLPGSSVYGIFPGKNTSGVAMTSSRGICLTQGSNLQSPASQADSLPSEQPGKPRGRPRDSRLAAHTPGSHPRY